MMVVIWFGYEYVVDEVVFVVLGMFSWWIVLVSNGIVWIEGVNVILSICIFEEVEGTWMNIDGLE